jgi:hypothetical protein
MTFLSRLSRATTRLRTFTFFITRLRKNVQPDCAHIFWLPVTKIPSVKTCLLIIVDYYTPRNCESWLLLLFCLINNNTRRTFFLSASKI